MALEKSLAAVYARRADVLLREVAGEQLLVPIRRDVADLQAIFALNALGVFVWERLDGERTVQAVLASIAERYDVGLDDAQADLLAFLERLSAAGLIEQRPS